MTKNLWAGLDVGVETTAVCVIDDSGEVLHERTCQTDPKIVHHELVCMTGALPARVGLEAATGTSLARGLRNLGHSIDLYETRRLSKFLRIRRNKSDAGDARGIAEAGLLGGSVVSKVYLKSLECQMLQSRLSIRRHLIKQRVAGVNLLRRQFEHYGGRLHRSKSWQLRQDVEREIEKLFGAARAPFITALRRLADHCDRLIAYQHKIDQDLNRCAQRNEVCRRLMGIPGVGPLCALAFYAAIGDPHRFHRSADVGSYFGLTPRSYQSGLTTKSGRISKMGNRAVRTLLVQASTSFMRWSSENSDLRAWTTRIEQRRGRFKSRVALARKLATIMLIIWKNDEPYQPRLSAATAE